MPSDVGDVPVLTLEPTLAACPTSLKCMQAVGACNDT